MVDRVVLSSREICGALLGPSCAKTYNPYDQEWNISIPDNKPPVTPVLPPKVRIIFCPLLSLLVGGYKDRTKIRDFSPESFQYEYSKIMGFLGDIVSVTHRYSTV